MGISRHQDIFISLTLKNQHMKELFHRFRDLANLCTGKEFEVQQNLIIPWTTTVNLLTDISQTAGQHQFYLRMHILYSFFYYKLTSFGRSINSLQLSQQLFQFFLGQQTDTFEHRNMSHRTEYIMFSQIKIHLTITSHRKTFDVFIYLHGFFPKFLRHNI